MIRVLPIEQPLLRKPLISLPNAEYPILQRAAIHPIFVVLVFDTDGYAFFIVDHSFDSFVEVLRECRVRGNVDKIVEYLIGTGTIRKPCRWLRMR